jgi:hypothetical protein
LTSAPTNNGLLSCHDERPLFPSAQFQLLLLLNAIHPEQREVPARRSTRFLKLGDENRREAVASRSSNRGAIGRSMARQLLGLSGRRVAAARPTTREGWQTSSNEAGRPGRTARAFVRNQQDEARLPRDSADDRRHQMDASEIQAKATIAAALIAVHAVEIPTMPKAGREGTDPAGVRLRDLTDYVYEAIMSGRR